MQFKINQNQKFWSSGQMISILSVVVMSLILTASTASAAQQPALEEPFPNNLLVLAELKAERGDGAGFEAQAHV